jgi:DNA helicase-2/ATP-dependent DNA helicase PcrA
MPGGPNTVICRRGRALRPAGGDGGADHGSLQPKTLVLGGRRGDRSTLGAFLGWLDAAQEQERGLDAGVVDQRDDAVRLLTVHRSKGLEWDVVAVTGLVEGTFPAGPNGNPPAKSKGWLTDIGAVPFPLRGCRRSM